MHAAEQTRELIEQTTIHAHELDLGGLTEPGQMQLFLRFERRQPAPIVAGRRNGRAEFRE